MKIIIVISILLFTTLGSCQQQLKSNRAVKKVADSLETEFPAGYDSLKFVEPELPASFPGGSDSLVKFIKRNLKYPHGTREIDGKVYVGFTVNEDGSVNDFKIRKGLSAECDKNAIECLKKMPRWMPGKINGKPAKQKWTVLVRFSLSGD